MKAPGYFSMLFGLILLSGISLAQEYSTLEPQQVTAVNACPVAYATDTVESPIVESKRGTPSTFTFSVYPNPAHSIVYLRLPILPTEHAWIRLLNSQGQIISEQEMPVLLRSFSYDLPEDLPAGKYLLEIESPSVYSRTKVTVCAY
jgi:hypothetical protein